jgi:tryptophan synthase alpha chain
MTSRLASGFDKIKTEGRGGLVAYVTAGDPDRARSAAVLAAVARGGADVIEVGVPFSDPLADGPVIQRASERALAAGMTLAGSLSLIREFRQSFETPIVLFTYANPVVRMDANVFAREASDAGVDGVLLLDYPVEEAEPLRRPLVDAGLDPIFLISPTTTDERISRSAELGAGFLYVISRLGVTGTRDALSGDVAPLIGRIRALTSLPVAVGFGISRPAMVAEACRQADAAVVGSALVQEIATHADAPDLASRVENYVAWLKSDL